MIRRITLQNYMSHADTIIELASGLTVLVGPNNCGKSAVVSALETLCNNATGSYMVRHEEKEALVKVETDDGHTFVWRRRGKVVSYSIDGKDSHRMRRGIPEDLHTYLRLPKVDAGENGEPFDVHIGMQKSPIFLLNEPESRAALFFASSSDAAILLEMQKIHRIKVRDRKNDERRLKREIETLNLELKTLEPLDALSSSVTEAETQFQGLKTAESHIRTLSTEIETLHEHAMKHDRIARRQESLALLTPPPDLIDTRPLESLITNLINAERRLRNEEDLCRTMTDLESPPALDDAQKLFSMCQEIFKEERNCSRLNAKVACLGPLNHPPVIDDLGPLERLVGDLESAERINLIVCSCHQVLQNLMPSPELTDPKPLNDLIEQLKDNLNDIERHDALIRNTTSSITEIDADMRAWETAHASPLQSVVVDRHTPRRLLVVLGGLAAIAAVIVLFMFGPAWFSNRDSRSADGDNAKVDSKATSTVGADDISETGKLPEFQITPNSDPTKEHPKEEPTKQKPIKEGPKTKESTQVEAKKEQPTPEKQQRLMQVRQLLNDAEMANVKGKYLDAVFGFGQAAILYPQELAEVESPEKVRLKFIDALKRYQAEVERALQKATEH
jgi:energy-coupling factor transporter ATP-binding protein EcfA2